ncbi:hypothetical protein H2201_005799 [Coniosporium apollinis]|uniref:DUF2461 domain-containing protein n=1 Tax=Coniosporium apollinis TaxID=61459 RepID=A0ABQ9NNX4_9PEZI|nr:hypothetical protein H2201_005799 [Coniosporium apollinis]
MARRPLAKSDVPASRSSSKRPPSPTTTPRQQPKRTRQATSLTTAKVSASKSKYFEEDSDDEQELSEPTSNAESATEQEESGYEDEDRGAASSELSSEAASEPDVSSEGEAKPRKRGRPKADVKAVGKQSKNEELWRHGVKTGLGPGTQVIIKKPKAREAGRQPYSNDSIHPNTILFLKDLAANNDREWLKMHDPDYRASQNDFNSFIESLTQKVISVDETIPELPIKDIVFRIYRDVRFSKDQTPYKKYFSAAWSRTGRKGPYAAYYVQVQPQGSFVGGGLWMPESRALALLRRDIDRKPHKIKRVLTDTGLRKEFFGGVVDDEKKAVRAFVSQSSENALKRKPKDYDADHEDIELLRLRNFTIGRKLKDEEVIGPNGLEHLTKLIQTMVPFISYLNSVVMPDNPEESSDEEDSMDENDEGNDTGMDDASQV